MFADDDIFARMVLRKYLTKIHQNRVANGLVPIKVA